MKKLLLGSASLCLFSISIMIFQMSCKKDATAQTSNSNYILPPATTSTLGGVIVGNGLSVTGNGTLSVVNSGGVTQQNKILYTKYFSSGSEYYICNFDGTNNQQINITLPANVRKSSEVVISPDHQKIFFLANLAIAPSNSYTYSCNLDGTNVQLVTDHGANATDIELRSAF